MQPLGEENLSFDGDMDGVMIGGIAPVVVADGGWLILFLILRFLSYFPLKTLQIFPIFLKLVL